MTAKKKAQSKQDRTLPLTTAEVKTALAAALGTDSNEDGLESATYRTYSSEALVEVVVTKRALLKGEDPREP